MTHILVWSWEPDVDAALLVHIVPKASSLLRIQEFLLANVSILLSSWQVAKDLKIAHPSQVIPESSHVLGGQRIDDLDALGLLKPEHKQLDSLDRRDLFNDRAKYPFLWSKE